MHTHHHKEVVAHTAVQQRTQQGIMGKLSSGYLQRATDIMPKQGKRLPWRISHNYLLDKFILKYVSFRDKNLSFRD